MKLATAVFIGGTALAVVLGAYLVYELSGAPLPKSLGAASDKIDCGKAKPLTAPTLGQFYDYSRDLARTWKADASPVRLDNLAMTAPLQADGSSRQWTAAFHSAGTGKSVLIHSGNGTLNCSVVAGQVAGNVPVVKTELARDGAAFYKLAEKHGKPLLAKGLGVGINLWANGEDHHATWHIAYYDRQGYPSGPRIIVNATTGAVEEVLKSK